MSYNVKLHPNVVRFLGKSPRDISRRIRKKLQEIRDDPLDYLEHYERQDVYKLNRRLSSID